MLGSGLLKRWKWRGDPPSRPDVPEATSGAVADLARALAIRPLTALLLHSRGYGDPDSARDFLDPKLTQLHDPALLPGCDAAAHRLEQAVRDQQPIVIYGDYDVDGITAAAILWHTLTLAGAQVSTYTPHRIDEGYGLNPEAISAIAEQHPKPQAPSLKPLIVSVDCGITAVEPAQLARELGLDLIITDHHEFPPGPLPPAQTIVHPRLPPEVFPQSRNSKPETRNYPFPHLCGASVAYKLAWHFARLHTGSERVPADYRALLLDLLSLAALGTIADVVPLIGENRVIARFGLGHIKQTAITGLNALIDASNLRDEKIDAYHVGFVLGPRLNAAGRMGHAKEAVQLLTTATLDEAKKTAEFLTEENIRRRATEKQIFDEAAQMVLDLGFDKRDCRAIVIGKENWHPGVIGIVASRLTEKFCRPVVLMNYAEGQAHGSARSVEGVSIHEAFTHCSQFLSSYGGHAMAAGLRMELARVDQFRAMIVQFINQKLAPEELSPVLKIDAHCKLADIDLPQGDEIDRLAPFGRSNPEPILLAKNLTLTQPPWPLGPTARHLRLMLRENNRVYQAIWFGSGDLIDKLIPGSTLDVAFEPVTSTWQNKRRTEIHVKDVRIVPPR